MPSLHVSFRVIKRDLLYRSFGKNGSTDNDKEETGEVGYGYIGRLKQMLRGRSVLKADLWGRCVVPKGAEHVFCQ